ncbi:MAG TPA: hypothetical protein VLC47_01705 [Burkholderiales bacterium]|nr:hypothetical protein [Burkholderiales bacterium]
MKVAFLHVGEDLRLPTIMAASAKRLGYELLQMTDEHAPAVPGVDAVVRLPWDGDRLMLYRVQHLAMLAEPVLIIDTDVMILRDVRPVWDREFDVALTRRTGPAFDPNGVDLAKEMPYNNGVIFSRSQAFWRRCYELYREFPLELQRWYGDQYAVRFAAPEFNVLELPVDPYNYSPATPEEDVSGKLIVHYKGKRKEWMLGKG